MLFDMKTAIFFIIATIITEVLGNMIMEKIKSKTRPAPTKEDMMQKITVRLVKKSWRPEGFDPNTNDPLHGYPGSYSELNKLLAESSIVFDYVAEPMASAKQLFDDPNYNASQPTVIVTHPKTANESYFVFHVVQALALRNLQKHYNVFAMHSPKLSNVFDTSSTKLVLGLDPHFKPLTEAFASFLLDGISIGKLKPYQISLIGFSFSATYNVFIAREIQKNTGQLIHTIMALDAFQFNKENQFLKPISRDDAMFVHSFHSCSKFLGSMQRISTVDIILNNGYYQPGCEEEISAGIKCSHRRMLGFIRHAIIGSYAFARQCDSWELFSNCKCSENPMIIVTFPVNEKARGTFYVRTSDKSPFILGPRGADCDADTTNPLQLQKYKSINKYFSKLYLEG